VEEEVEVISRKGGGVDVVEDVFCRGREFADVVCHVLSAMRQL
jgi:hypothetical protein